jgi:sigma-B regulation protein RsbU (phosphoserine phosphatase)
LYQSTDATKFVTLFTCILNTDNDELTYVNAGHNDPLLISKDGQIKKLNVGGLLLGCLPESIYSESVFSLIPGDLLVIYTDGITEAMNALQEEFGESRLIALLKSHQNLTCKEITDTVFSAVKKHMQSEPQFDDMTMLLVKKNF